MAETKKKTVAPASDSSKKSSGEKKITEAAPVGNAGGYRALAILFWVLAIGCEVLALLFIFGQLNLLPKNPQILWIPALVLDLIFVIIGSQFWKKANRIKPASKKNKTLFWLWNNMGLIACCVAFLPFVILVLSNKNLDKKTKMIASIAGVVALLIAGAASYDYNPISQEEMEAATGRITSTVYWTSSGKVYHICGTVEDRDAKDTDGDPLCDCSSTKNSTTFTYGTVDEAIAANRTRLCKICAQKFGINTDGLLTDDSEE
jgi:hypothetical protein